MKEKIIFGPEEENTIWYESLGHHLFDCLRKRKSTDIIAVHRFCLSRDMKILLCDSLVLSHFNYCDVLYDPSLTAYAINSIQKIDAFTKETLTCGELLNRSIKLSIALKKLSVRKGDVIGLITENNLQNYVITCATLYCGAQLNLLNFSYTLGELKHVFEISKPKIIFCSKTAVQNILRVKEVFDCIETIILMESDDALQIQSLEDVIKSIKNIDSFDQVKVDLNDTAILALSSGTTGLPKCVEISHENFIPLINNAHDRRYFNISSNDTGVLVLPFFHIYGLDIHLLAITNSLKVISMNAFKPEVYLQVTEEYKATKLFLAPPILQFLVTSPLVSKYNLTSVTDMIVGASGVKTCIYEEALRKFKNCSIRQVYGSSETRAIAFQDGLTTTNNVGQLFSNTFVKIVDIKTGSLLGPYENGEICVKSLSIMKGYLKNHLATKHAIDSDGFYQTGDIGYYDQDKNIYLVDRIKELIKYKGFQVPPVEVENVLLSHTGVKDCGVVGIPDDRCGQLPVAFVVRKPDSNVTGEELIKFVAEHLSIQKHLHGGVRFINDMPRLPSGKLLRRELVKQL